MDDWGVPYLWKRPYSSYDQKIPEDQFSFGFRERGFWWTSSQLRTRVNLQQGEFEVVYKVDVLKGGGKPILLVEDNPLVWYG